MGELGSIGVCMSLAGLGFAIATQQRCAEGQSPFAEGLGVSPNSNNSLESPFDKGGLRGFGGQGAEREA